nr:hypothetical protein [Geodermatophilaceae bacterium]
MSLSHAEIPAAERADRSSQRGTEDVAVLRIESTDDSEPDPPVAACAEELRALGV